MNVKNLLFLTSLSMLAACDWVDSTGRESNSAPVTQITFDDGQNTAASVVNEETSMRLSVSASDADGEINAYQWLPEPIADGVLDDCVGVSGFELAAESLDAACALEIAEADCNVTFEELLGDGEGAEFRVVTPQLRAPIGVTYQLDAVDNEGGTGSQLLTFCLIAINEAPDANDDTFTVREGEVLTVTAEPGNQHLLSNDEQDDHVSNTDLRVLEQPSSAPTLARSLSLQSDGGFIYESELIEDRTAESQLDTFVYTVTDGIHFSIATVTVKVLARNDPPKFNGPIPLQQVTAGVEFESDLSVFFDDEEGATLSFVIAGGSVPELGQLTLSANGVLSGTAESIDEGSYTIQIIASDGSKQTTAELDINVVANLPVVAQPIAPQFIELGEALALDLSDYFTDPEGKPLTYLLNTESNSATIDVNPVTGVLKAEFAFIGRYPLDVSAEDGVNAPVDIRFLVTVSSDNVAPDFGRAITNQTAKVGVPFGPIDFSTRFSDTDNDDQELTYSIIGTLPDGLTLNANGVLSGTPTEDGISSGIRIVATDPFGKSARSNGFLIWVLPAIETASPSNN